jgi:hypothetical protein
MNIPLDNLYHWVRGCADEPVSIYIFRPHGSKNIADLDFFEPIDTNVIAPEIICHDQEPVNVLNCQDDTLNFWNAPKNENTFDSMMTDRIMTNIAEYYQKLKFFAKIRIMKPRSIFDRFILLHSEKNSKDIELLSSDALPVYYWAHGIIAKDWYRFAEHDPRLNLPSTHKKTFLVYCRAWTGTREYRLKFLELLIEKNLIEHSQISILHQDQNFMLRSYVCNDYNLQPNNIEQLTNIDQNNFSSDSSACYHANDLIDTDISIVLETVASDTKIHLTEKTLRPIACGHPFILLAGPGSLKYLKSYGFKTFSPWINESYDDEPNINKRMQLIVAEMYRIQQLPLAEKTQLLSELKKITEYNKNHFFSNSFTSKIFNELTENLNQAISSIKATKGSQYFAIRKIFKTTPRWKSLKKIIFPRGSYEEKKLVETAKVLRLLRHDPSTNLKQIIDQYPEGFFNL